MYADNNDWTLGHISVDHAINGDDGSEVTATYYHKDGRVIEHSALFILKCDVLVNGERPGYLDGFVESSDDDYDRAVSEAVDDDEVTRQFWVYPDSEEIAAISDDESLDPFIGEREQITDGWIDLQYKGRYDADGTELDDEMTAVMTDWIRGYDLTKSPFVSLDVIYSDLTAA